MPKTVAKLGLLAGFVALTSPLEAQNRLSPTYVSVASTPVALLDDRGAIGVERREARPRPAPFAPTGGPSGRGSRIFAGITTGVFFGAILGGIHGDSQEDCTGCDFYGAVAGGFLGGVAGLVVSLAVPMR